MNFQNKYTFTDQKTLFHTLLYFLFLKSSKAFSVSDEKYIEIQGQTLFKIRRV